MTRQKGKHVKTKNWGKLLIVSTVGFALAIAGCGSTSNTAGPSSDQGNASPSSSSAAKSASGSSDKVTVRMAVVYAQIWSAWSATQDAVKDPNVKMEVSPFTSSNDEFLALRTGNVDMSANCVNTIGAALAETSAEDLDISVIAGLSPGQSEVLVRKDSGIKSWDDVRGKKVGLVRGSAEYVKMQIALAQHGIDLAKDTDLTTVQSAADLVLALQRGDVQAIVTYQPYTAQAVDGGFAVEPAGMNKELHELAGVPCDIVVRNDFKKAHPQAVQAVIDAYIGVWQSFENNPKNWVDATLKYQTGDKDLMLAAAKQMKIWYIMQDKTHEAITKKLAKYDVIPKDTSSQLESLFDYSFLAKATGKTPEDLGKGQ